MPSREGAPPKGLIRSTVFSRTGEGLAATGRSPGFRVVAWLDLPVCTVVVCELRSPVTVAGTAPVLIRLPFSPQFPGAPVTGWADRDGCQSASTPQKSVRVERSRDTHRQHGPSRPLDYARGERNYRVGIIVPPPSPSPIAAPPYSQDSRCQRARRAVQAGQRDRRSCQQQCRARPVDGRLQSTPETATIG